MDSCCAEPAYLNLPGWRCVPVYALPHDTTPPSPPRHKLMPSSIPPDPRLWSRRHVVSWLEWCVDSFALPPVDQEKFLLNGLGLSLLKKSDFCERAPRCGDVLFNALQVLLGRLGGHNNNNNNNNNGTTSSPPPHHHHPGVSATLLQHAAAQHQEKGSPFALTPSRPGWPRSVSSDFHSMGHVIHEGEAPQSDDSATTAGSPPPPRDPDDPASEDAPVPLGQVSGRHQPLHAGDVDSSAEKINVRLLWDFLQQLLNDSRGRYRGCIVWKDRARGVFKITDPPRLASLWGRQKNHLNMNFDKMSRALRYYYRVRILQKEPGERHCYRFLRHPSELRHCKQRSLLARDTPADEAAQRNGGGREMVADIEAALDMSIKEEGNVSP